MPYDAQYIMPVLRNGKAYGETIMLTTINPNKNTGFSKAVDVTIDLENLSLKYRIRLFIFGYYISFQNKNN